MTVPDVASEDWQAAHSYRGKPPLAGTHLRSSSVVDAFVARASATPAAPFITEVARGSVSGRVSGRSVSYGEVLARVRARAAALDAAGVTSGVRVGFRPHNNIDGFVTILAILWTGAAVVLVNPRDAEVRVTEQYRSIQAIDYRTLDDDVRTRETRPPSSRVAHSIIDGDKRPVCMPDDVAVVIFTSGSTGVPRAVAQSHHGIQVNSAAVAAHHALGPSTRLFACLPLFHVNALEFTGFASMISGSHLFMAEAFDPLAYLGALSEARADIASVVPSILTAITDRKGISPALPELRYFVSAAAPLAAVTVRRVNERLGKRIVQGYGLSEAGNFSCLMPPDLNSDAYARLMSEAIIPSIGPSLAGNDVDVLGPDGQPAELEEPGEIVVRGPNVMIGYLGDAVATKAVFRGGWLHTGDLGMKLVDPAIDSPVFVVTGRAKNVVKVGGHTIGLEEVERAVLSLDGIEAVAASSANDPRFGEVLGVLAVRSSIEVDSAKVRAVVEERIGPDHTPRYVRFVDALPLLDNGKLARIEVSKLLQDAVTSTSP